MTPRYVRAVLGIAAAVALPSAAGSQTIAERVANLSTGTVRFSFAARPGVCGSGVNSITTGGTMRLSFGSVHQSYNDEWESDTCDPGPVRVSLDVRDGRVTKLRTYVGGRWRNRPADRGIGTDFGVVPARSAAEYLLSLATRGEPTSPGDAILPAFLADSVVIWPRLLRLARDQRLPRDTRRQAVFWVGQAAGEAVTASLDSLVRVDDVNRDLKEHAIFALSQRPEDEGVPVLIRLVRTLRDPELRRKALFWLGESDDPRALALFEEILRR